VELFNHIIGIDSFIQFDYWLLTEYKRVAVAAGVPQSIVPGVVNFNAF
jgi:hypothetical protein